MSMKNSNDTIGNRTRDLPTCNAVPQPTALPRAPPHYICIYIYIYINNVLPKRQYLFTSQCRNTPEQPSFHQHRCANLKLHKVNLTRTENETKYCSGLPPEPAVPICPPAGRHKGSSVVGTMMMGHPQPRFTGSIKYITEIRSIFAQ